MAVDHVQVVLAHRSGFVRDNVINTWTFETEAALDGTTMATIDSALSNFYNGAASGATQTISERLSNCLSRTTLPVTKHYDVTDHLNGNAAGSPIRIGSLTALNAMSASAALPSEVAIALSFHADYGSDAEFAAGVRPRARDRGRIYLGPLGDNCRDIEAATNIIRVSAGARTDILAHATKLVADLGASIVWSAWSRRAARVSQVTVASVDDTFDVQRRREERSLVRQSVGLI